MSLARQHFLENAARVAANNVAHCARVRASCSRTSCARTLIRRRETWTAACVARRTLREPRACGRKCLALCAPLLTRAFRGIAHVIAAAIARDRRSDHV